MDPLRVLCLNTHVKITIKKREILSCNFTQKLKKIKKIQREHLVRGQELSVVQITFKVTFLITCHVRDPLNVLSYNHMEHHFATTHFAPGDSDLLRYWLYYCFSLFPRFVFQFNVCNCAFVHNDITGLHDQDQEPSYFSTIYLSYE